MQVSRFIFVLVATIAMAQVIAGLYFSLDKASLDKADMVIVFPGDAGRSQTGCRLLRDGLAANLMVVNTPRERVERLMRKEEAPAGVNALSGGTSRSTFEDAFNAAQAIEKNDFDSVILVTSSYHLPRAWLLLQGFLAAKGMRVAVQCCPAEQGSDRARSRTIKLYYNEVVKFWGSSAEMLGYFVTNRLPMESAELRWVSSFVKGHLLFEA